eukprot:COSAG03_NODE_8472_length_799_cov_2.310000_1_plen_64_part_00
MSMAGPIPAAVARDAFDLGDPAERSYLNAAGRSPLLRAGYAAALDGVGMKLRPWAFGDAGAPH